MSVDLVLGTAGHVDHGKTSLIRALTGVDTDRLPEEKRRGITIDLGFAHLVIGDYRLGIVDVPGHERFIRNMLAGASGMDLAMLVVAADEGVKQQTREHFDILRMVDVRGGVIAITKADLVADDWLELVESEIRGLVAGSVLADAPLVRTSVVSGSGLDKLQGELARAAARVSGLGEADDGKADLPFRLPIDRSFSLPGHGTVVTGTVASGSARVGEELVIEPGALPVRVRGLHHHDQPVGEVHRGQRAAINLAGVHHDAVRRGQELATPGYLTPSKLLTARITLLADAPKLKSRMRLRLHLGTAEVMATATLVDADAIEASGSGLVQLFLAEPVVATWNQPVVIRSQSPARTIGGGRVLEPSAARLRRPDSETINRLKVLRDGTAAERAAATLYLAGWRAWQPADLPRLAGIAGDAALVQQLAAGGELREIRVSPTRTMFVHPAVVSHTGEQVVDFLRRLHDKSPLAVAFPRASLEAAFRWLGEGAALATVLDEVRRAGQIREAGAGIGLADRGPKLTRAQQTLYTELINWIRQAGIGVPSLPELKDRAGNQAAAVPQLLAVAAGAGELVQIAPELWLHTAVEADARQAVQARLGTSGFTVSELRELLGTTRKYAVPLCEYWDRVGFTIRSGDRRTVKGK
jgi:selenocysteine-specific elongation factor